MLAQVTVQFIGKTAPNTEKGKTKFHYGMVVCDKDITKELASDFAFLDTWQESDIKAQPGDRYVAQVNIQGDFIMFDKLISKLGK